MKGRTPVFHFDIAAFKAPNSLLPGALPLTLDRRIFPTKCAHFVPAASFFFKKSLTFSNVMDQLKAKNLRLVAEILGFMENSNFD